ncbi:hypothetical protein RGQ29_014062 [Quercus rubra]|uniref:Uncharacterized protein n=1 Tax=Quercus rubra TaxID=3512 RepID=A0AAN7IVK1_QUERU|nr:hypothetical protein RGQ29_014062 [Quercus rubra]
MVDSQTKQLPKQLIVRITFAAPKLLTICNANKGILSVNWSHRHHLITPSIFLSETSSCPLNSCTHMIIAGYWVGPDLDDGWGFVEAFVNQIT